MHRLLLHQQQVSLVKILFVIIDKLQILFNKNKIGRRDKTRRPILFLLNNTVKYGKN